MGAAVHAQSRTLSLSFQKLRARVDACGGHRTGRGRVASHADELPTPWAAMVWWGRESGSSPVSHGRSCQAPPVSRGVAMFDPTWKRCCNRGPLCKSHRSRCLGEPATPPGGPAAPRPSPCPRDGGHPVSTGHAWAAVAWPRTGGRVGDPGRRHLCSGPLHECLGPCSPCAALPFLPADLTGGDNDCPRLSVTRAAPMSPLSKAGTQICSQFGD